MAKITKILDSDLPSDIFLSEKGMKTKKIYFRNDGDDINNFYYIGEGNTEILGYNEKEKICLFVDYPEKIFADIYVKLYENNNQISSTLIGTSRGNASYGRPSGTFCVEFNSPITIESSGISVYCIPEKTIELKPMPKIDKLTDTSSFENVSTKLQEINNLLKVSSDNLKTIMDANSLMYEPTDNFSTLVQKLNNEPINFLLEGTKIRSIFGKYLSIYPSAPPVGVEYYHLEFTNIKNDSWIDLKEDLSLKQDGSISLYKESINDGRNDQTTYYIYSENKIYANIDSSYMFNLGLSMIDSINFKNLYVDYVENASHLFEDISGNNGDCPLCSMINFLNLRFKNIKNISYMFNHYDLAGENHFRVESNNIIDYSNFCENHDWNNGYHYLILDYINDKTKKIAETIVSESKNNVKLGTLVTQ